MQTFHAADYGIAPGGQIARPLAALLNRLQGIPGKKALLFQPGTYHIDRDECETAYYAITNTVSQKEYRDAAQTNLHRIAIHLRNLDNLTIDGQGAVFRIDGKVTNCVVSNCKNVTLQNFKLDTQRPNLHKLTVQKVSPFAVWFRLDTESRYERDGDSFTWVGKGYRLGFLENVRHAFWTASIQPAEPHRLYRTSHPFFGAHRMEEIKPYQFKAHYLFRKPMQAGQTFYVFDAMRSDVGIFLERSENLALKNIAQYFNYSLGIVAQDCCNLSFHKLHMAPKEGSQRGVASLADFMQICMCAGDVNITDCYFDGAADDALNVHGIHFKTAKRQGRELTVKFCHAQSWGFNPLYAGDRIAFINPQTLLCVAENKILTSEQLDRYQIRLELEHDSIPAATGTVIEDIDRCPNIYFAGNTLDRIITRGLLLTTRGKIIVEHNHFVNIAMSGILHSDDAKSWYESGMVQDVTIRDNRFDCCGQTPILIKPENSRHAGAVHQNIQILDNVFSDYSGSAIRIKSAENIVIQGNQFSGEKRQITARHVSKLQIEKQEGIR